MGQNASNMANWPVHRRQSSRVRNLVSADFESRPVDVSACTYRLAPTAPTADSNLESAEYRRLTPTIELAISTHLPTNADFQSAVGDIDVVEYICSENTLFVKIYSALSTIIVAA